MTIKCDPRAYAKCPTRELCGEYCDDVCFEEGSDCDKFNQEVINAPPTNGDRIRSMTDEELAEILQEEFCPDGRDFCDKDCVNCWLKWLRKPAEEVQGDG